MTLTLYEYGFNGSAYTLCGTLYFVPDPNSIDKGCKVKKRFTTGGLYKIYPKMKYRWKREITFTVRGGCNAAKRREIEFYAMRYSVFKIDNASWTMITPEYYSENNATMLPYNNPYSPTGATQDIYVAMDEASFTQAEANVDWFTYSITLKAVRTDI